MTLSQLYMTYGVDVWNGDVEMDHGLFMALPHFSGGTKKKKCNLIGI